MDKITYSHKIYRLCLLKYHGLVSRIVRHQHALALILPAALHRRHRLNLPSDYNQGLGLRWVVGLIPAIATIFLWRGEEWPQDCYVGDGCVLYALKGFGVRVEFEPCSHGDHCEAKPQHGAVPCEGYSSYCLRDFAVMGSHCSFLLYQYPILLLNMALLLFKVFPRTKTLDSEHEKLWE